MYPGKQNVPSDWIQSLFSYNCQRSILSVVEPFAGLDQWQHMLICLQAFI